MICVCNLSPSVTMARSQWMVAMDKFSSDGCSNPMVTHRNRGQNLKLIIHDFIVETRILRAIESPSTHGCTNRAHLLPFLFQKRSSAQDLRGNELMRTLISVEILCHDIGLTTGFISCTHSTKHDSFYIDILTACGFKSDFVEV